MFLECFWIAFIAMEQYNSEAFFLLPCAVQPGQSQGLSLVELGSVSPLWLSPAEWHRREATAASSQALPSASWQRLSSAVSDPGYLLT